MSSDECDVCGEDISRPLSDYGCNLCRGCLAILVQEEDRTIGNLVLSTTNLEDEDGVYGKA